MPKDLDKQLKHDGEHRAVQITDLIRSSRADPRVEYVALSIVSLGGLCSAMGRSLSHGDRDRILSELSEWLQKRIKRLPLQAGHPPDLPELP